ncbi:unnamed protein product [marine sediment metagenome]|uniref:Uncharacterized protein n=1 Tax=marine sediment metagenome TaxID=412755 RepID=X1R3U2_9ZZZZ
MMDHPLQFRIEGYNEDETNYHVLTVRLELEPAIDPMLSLVEMLEARLPLTTGEMIGVLPDISESMKAVFTLIEQGIIPILHSMEAYQQEKEMADYATKPLSEIATI